MELCSRVDGKTISIKSDYSCRHSRRNGMAGDIDVLDLKSYLKQIRPMSFPCVLGMHEVGWEDGSYRNGTTPKHGASTRSSNGGVAKNSAFDVVSGKSNGEVASYLFQRQGVASSFPKTVGEKEEGFGGRQWSSVERMSDQNDEDNEELEGKFQSMTLNNNEKKADTPIEEIASTAKKLWDVQDSGEEKTGMSTGILQGDQWRENAWGPSVPLMNQSEHAVSQPIMVQHSVKRGAYNSNSSELHGVLSPRSADGVGLSMVEYVLASSPGGQELDAQMIKSGFDGEDDGKSNIISKAARVSPFEEETPEELQREQDLTSPKPKTVPQPDDDGTMHSAFSRTPGSRDPSPTTSSSQHSQDALQSSQAQISNPSPIIHTKSRNQLHDFREVPPSSISLDTVNLEQLNFEHQQFPGTPLSPSEVVMVSGGSLPGTHTSSLQHLSPQQIALAVAAQHQQQQQLQSAMAQQNPYYITATQGQDMYGSGSLPQVNPGAQMVPQPYAAAAYSIQPWGVYPGAANVSGSGNFLQQQQQQQQQPQQQQQQQQQQHAQLMRSTSNPGVGGQQLQTANQIELLNNPQQPSMAANTNYQLIAPPGAPPLGLGAAAYYDQSGNLVLSNTQGINGVSPQQLAANQMGGALRMMSPMLLNAANSNANNAPGRMGNSAGASGMRMYGQQAQQQLSVSASMNTFQNQVPMNGNAVGVVGNSLGILGGSSNVGAVGSMTSGTSRRDVLNSGDYSAFNKRQAIQGYYPSLGGSLTVSAQPSYNSPQELPTPPLLSQGSQSGFSVGSPISSGLSRYMQLSTAPDKKFQNPLSSLNGSPFGNSVLTQGGYRGGGRLKDTGRSRLLEDFRNNRYPNIQLRDLANHIVEFSQDQHGSRFIQQKLERASPVEKNMVFHEILPAAYSLMTDVFGNYVIQKFFEFGSDDQKHHLASCIRGNVLPLALQMYGCRVIQKALECIPPNVQIKHELVMELDGHVLKCVKDQNGNHVVQKCIECVDPHALQFIIDAFQGQVYALSTHPYGCRVIQRILEHCLPEQTMPILAEMHDQTERLVQDQYGNYVIQHVLEHGTPEDRNKIVMQLRGNILVLSQHKFASNVVEKCVSFASRAERAVLIDEVCNTTDSQTQQSALYLMMKDQFANYVVQKMIDVAEPVQRKLLMHRIRPHISTLRKYTYGKHILAKLEKYYMTVKPTPDFLPLTNGQLL
ncbi:pumilio homolog 2 [Exaiptasia diaphana]|uniref:PUM-HD domain-containing protein n=1 Tax=Exaiptasia diaphana TaxID=2652724 RepID=A0A913XSC9_EXADI|nr:pumilio homolog 2 [Exaiptasia diaphana]